MQTVWSVYGMLALLFLTLVIGYCVAIVALRPATDKASQASLIRLALNNLGVQKPAWNTLVITATRDVRLPVEALWEAWSNLDDWSMWSCRHLSARWTAKERWQPGAQFEQVMNLGFPLGRQKVKASLAEVSPGRTVRWSTARKGSKTCHIWSFTLLPNRQVRLTTTEVFQGDLYGLLKPLLILQWQKPLNRSLDALIRLAKVSQAGRAQSPAAAAEPVTAH